MPKHMRGMGQARNGAPKGYGQQQGQSPFLDQPQNDMASEPATQMAHERMAPAAPAMEPLGGFEQDMPQMPQDAGAEPAFMTALKRPGMKAPGMPMQGAPMGKPQMQPRMAGAPAEPDDPYGMTDAMGFGRGEVDALNAKVAGMNAGSNKPVPTAASGIPPGGNPLASGGNPLASPRNTGINGGMPVGAPQALPGGPGGAPGGAIYGNGHNPLAGGMPPGGPGAPPQAPGAPGADGGVDPRSTASRAAAANGWTDIAGAESLQAGAYAGALEGFNTQGWGSGERGSNTHKNTFGKLASRYDPMDPQSTQKLMSDPDFKAFFPDAKLIEHPNADMIDFGDGNPVDIKRASVNGASPAWQWGTDAGASTPGGMPGGPGAPGAGAPGANGMDPNMAAQLAAALQGGGQFGDGSITIEQIMASLGLGPQQTQQPAGRQSAERF